MPRWVRYAFTSLVPIVLVALAMRLWFAWDYQRHAPHQALSAIPFLFESGNIATSLAKGHGFGSPFRVDTGPTAWMTPLYPLLLSWIMRIFGVYTYQSWVAAVCMNICFSTLVCVPVYFTGKRIGGVAVAAIAGWLWAVFPNAILLSFQSLWDTSLSALLGIGVVWATLRVAGSKKPVEWWAYGLLWGTALMANASLLSLLPPLLGWAVWKSRDYRNGALALGVAVLCCLPWTVRNYRVFHAFVPLRSVLGLQLWVGNNPDAKVVWLGEQHPIHDSAERDRYVEMGEIAYMKEKLDRATAYIFTHPARESGLIAGRFTMFWSGGSPHPLDDFLRNKSAWFRYVLIFNLVEAAGALAGIVWLFRAGGVYAFPMAAGPAIFPFAYYMTLSLPRYRHPIDPGLMVLLAFGVWKVLGSVRGITPRSAPGGSLDPTSRRSARATYFRRLFAGENACALTPRRRYHTLMRAVVLFLTATALPAAAVDPTIARLQQQIEFVAHATDGVVGVSATHIESGKTVSVRGTEAFPMASAFKVPVAVQLMSLVEAGQLTLDKMIALGPQDLHPGSGKVSELMFHPGVALSVENLMELMLVISDNSAADLMLREAGGGEAVTARMKALGLPGIRVDRPTALLISDWVGAKNIPPEDQWNRDMWDQIYNKIPNNEHMQARRAQMKDPRDTATPDDMTRLLVRIWRKDLFSRANANELLGMLERCQTGKARIKGMLPQGTDVAHKTGTLGGVANDVGVITLPNGLGHVAISVFTKASTKSEDAEEKAVAEVSRTVYDYFVLFGGSAN